MLDKYNALLLPLLMLAGYVCHRPLAHALGIVPALFVAMTVISAMGLGKKELAETARNYRPALYGLLAGCVLFPVLIFAALEAFGIGGPMRLGIMLSQVMPAGVTAVAWVALARGHIGAVVSMIALSTAAAPLTVPLAMRLLGGAQIGLDTGSLLTGLVAYVLAPCAGGVLLGRWLPPRERTRHVWPLASKLLLMAVVLLNAASAADAIRDAGSQLGRAAAATGALIAGGYALSWAVQQALKPERPLKIAYTYAGGVRNYTAALVLAHMYLPAGAAVPVMLAMTMQHPAALLVHLLFSFRFRDRKARHTFSGEAGNAQ